LQVRRAVCGVASIVVCRPICGHHVGTCLQVGCGSESGGSPPARPVLRP
jgi:hypothetical protein